MINNSTFDIINTKKKVFMQDLELSKLFELNRTTLYNWKKAKIKGRRLLYEVLKNLPNEYIESIQKKIEEEEKLKENLKKEQE